MAASTIRTAIQAALERSLPRSLSDSVLGRLPPDADSDVGSLDVVSLGDLLRQVESALSLFARHSYRVTMEELRRTVLGGRPASPRRESIRVGGEGDVLLVQNRCRAITRCFFGPSDCVRLAVVCSELARNIYMYAGTGHIELGLTQESDGHLFGVVARDQGPGISTLEAILGGTYVSKTGLGKGLQAARNLLDDFAIETGPRGGTTVRGSKWARRR